MEDRVKLVFILVAIALFLVFVLLAVFYPYLPNEILGLDKSFICALPIGGIFLLGMGWNVVMWFRTKD